MLPVILAAFSGGVVVDRFDFKRSIIVADSASTAVALIPLLHLTTGLAFWQVMGPLSLLATGYLLEIVHIQLALAGIAVWFLAGIVALAAAKVDFGVAAPS